VGREAADQIQGIIKNVALEGKGGFAAIIGIITLLIGATTVFAEIQDSINSIWGLKAKAKLGVMKLLKDRLLSFGIIGSLGFLLLVSLGVSAIVDALGNSLKNAFPDIAVVFFYVVNLLLTLAITTGLFGVIFKVLPDAKIKWKDVFGGALATSVLFMIGKLLISLYISKSDIGTAYGAAGSLVILIVWIYYSSIILYFGAEFTKAYAIKYGSEIRPSQFAITMKTIEVEGGKQSVQQVEKSKDNDLGLQPSQKNARAKAQYLPTPKLQFESDRPPLRMFYLIQALAVTVIEKLSDFGKKEKRN
jgi:membrane protein